MKKSPSTFLVAILIFTLPALLTAQVENKVSALLIAYDQLVRPGKKILVKAKLVSQGLMFRNRPVGGERIEFLIDGKSAGIGLTGGDGVAVKEIGPLPPGEHPVTLRLKSTQYTVPEVQALLAVWEPEPPVLVLNLAAAVEEKEGRGQSLLEPHIEMVSRPDAIRVLKIMAREYNLLFFTDKEETRLAEIRTWLASQKFPSAPLLAWKFGPGPATHELVLDEELQALHSAGWTNLKVGIGATALDAEPFLSIGLKTIILADETENGMDMPAGTIKATDWKKMEQAIGKIAGP
jgi:hypothetical protein